MESQMTRREQLEDMTVKELRVEFEAAVGEKAPAKMRSPGMVEKILEVEAYTFPALVGPLAELHEDDFPPGMIEEQIGTPRFWGRPIGVLHIAAVLLLAQEVSGTAQATLTDAHDALEAAVPSESDGVKYEDRFQPQFERLYEGLVANQDELNAGGLHEEVGAIALTEWEKRQAEAATSHQVETGASGEGRARKAPTPPKPVVELTPELVELAVKAKVSRVPPPGGQQSVWQMIATEKTRAELGDAAFTTQDGLLAYAKEYLTLKADTAYFVSQRDGTELGKACQAAFQAKIDVRRYWKPVSGEGRVTFDVSEKRHLANVG